MERNFVTLHASVHPVHDVIMTGVQSLRFRQKSGTSQCRFFGGSGGIRTPVGFHPNGFQDRRVMTTSLRFHNILSFFYDSGGLSTVYGLTLTRLGGAPRRALTAFAIPSLRSLQDRRARPVRYASIIYIKFLFISGGLSTVYGLTLAAQSASRYSVAALLTRPPRKTCSLRFRIEFALRLYHSNRAVAREYQKNIEAFAKISDNRVKFVAFSIRSCYNSFRTWGYSSVGRALASHVRGQGFDSPYLHQ